jgi:hypothetical protein
MLGHFEFQIVSGRVRSGIGSFRFLVVSGWVWSGIGSSSIGSFRVSGHIRSGRVGYPVVQCRIISGYESYQIRADRVGFSGRVGSDQIGL